MILQLPDHADEILFKSRPRLCIGSSEPFVRPGIRKMRPQPRECRRQISHQHGIDPAAAMHHILPHDHAQTVTVIIPPLRFDLLMLADDLATRFQGCENLKVYVALLHEFAGKINAHKTQEQKEKDYFAIRERLKGYGLLRQKKLPTALNRFRCFADSTYDETILPDGRVGRCEHVSESMITGHISREERDETVTKRWQEPLVVPECNHCSLYPQCRKLSMCEWNRKGCHDLDRRIDIAERKEQMLAAYQEWKKGENEI